MRRWQVAVEEQARIDAERRKPMTGRAALTLLSRNPRLVPEVLRDVVQHAANGVFQSSALVWLLDSERVRQQIPDAARGIGFTNERSFLEVLSPRISREAVVLDVGGGDGRLSRHVAPIAAEVVVSDVSATMIREAAENLASLTNVRTHHARGFTLHPLENEEFDVVFAQGVLSYLEVNQGLALLDEMARVARDGAALVINAFTMDQPHWREEQLAAVRLSARRGRFTGGLFRSYCERQVELMVEAAGFEILNTTYGGNTETERLPYIVSASRRRRQQ